MDIPDTKSSLQEKDIAGNREHRGVRPILKMFNPRAKVFSLITPFLLKNKKRERERKG